LRTPPGQLPFGVTRHAPLPLAPDGTLTEAGREIRDLVEAFSECRPDLGTADIAAVIAEVYTAERPRWWRVKLAWRIIR